MAINIQTVSESIDDNGIKVLVHGLAGAGKTVFCASAGAPTLIISAEGGMLSIKGAIKKGILPKEVLNYVRVAEIRTKAELEEIRDWLQSETGEDQVCDWVALDSISEIAEVILAEELEKSKDPRQAYGALTIDTMALLRSFRDLPGYNVVMSCKQHRVVDGDTGRSMYVPLLPGTKLAPALPFIFDEVFALRVEQDKDDEGNVFDYRIIQTDRDRNYEAKDRSGMLDMFEQPNLGDIAAKIKEGGAEFDRENAFADAPDTVQEVVEDEVEGESEAEADVDQAESEPEPEADAESEKKASKKKSSK